MDMYNVISDIKICESVLTCDIRMIIIYIVY